MNAYEEKQEARRARLTTAAERARARSDAAFKRVKTICDGIPFGQPILVGHHSERRASADVKRISQGMDRAVSEDKAARELAGRAAAVGSAGVSADDPDAVAKLRAELVACETNQARMKAANAAIRKGKTDQDRAAALLALGIKPGMVAQILTPDFCGRTGFADFQTSNNAASMRRIKARIAVLEARPAGVTTETERAGVRIVKDVDDNRLRLIFPGKPDEETRVALKSAGFRWSPTAGAWQRQLNNSAIHAANAVLQNLED